MAVDSKVLPLDETKSSQFIKKRRPGHFITPSSGHDPYPINRARRLGQAQAGSGRLTSRNRGKEPKHLPPPHSMTSSARASSDWGRVRPSALAVFKLITSSNLVGCCTG